METMRAAVFQGKGKIGLREVPRPFKTPLWQVTAPLGVVACLYLVFSLPMVTFVRLFVWMIIGLVVYFLYAHRNAKYRKSAIAEASAAAE